MSEPSSDSSGQRFVGVDLRGARFHDVDLSGAVFREVSLQDVRMRGVELDRVEIDGDLREVRINGIDVAPLIEAEHERRDPDYAAMKPTDPAGFGTAWEIRGRRWSETVERARRLDPTLLHESVDDEWSFIETLRHLTFATDSWVGRMILGEPAPWHALGLPWDTMPPTPGVPQDRTARPDLEEVLALREDRASGVQKVIDALTPEELDREVTAPEGPGWPPTGRTHTVGECLRVVLNEEWWHRVFAERDLAVLESR